MLQRLTALMGKGFNERQDYLLDRSLDRVHACQQQVFRVELSVKAVRSRLSQSFHPYLFR